MSDYLYTAELKIKALEDKIEAVKDATQQCFGKNPLGNNGWLLVQVSDYNSLVDALNKDVK